MPRAELRAFVKVNNKENELVVREPGQVYNCPFAILKCKNSDIYVHDWITQVTADEVDNCNIVLGPCSSSAFIRTTTNSRLVIFCQQLRMRDCVNVDIMLYSHTEVSIPFSAKLLISLLACR
jgi:hypothetical protein